MVSTAERARARADARALGDDEVASACLGPGAAASRLDAVLLDVEREALDRVAGDRRGRPQGPQGYLVGIEQLAATMDGIRRAHAARDRVGLRGELINLAAQAAEWAARAGPERGR